MPDIASRLDNVTVLTKANIYFDGRVISHTILMPDGKKKTVGVALAGTYKFNTAAAEHMEIVAGACRVRQAGQAAWTPVAAGNSFRVPANSSFDFAVDAPAAEYICSFE